MYYNMHFVKPLFFSRQPPWPNNDAICEGLKKFSNWPTYPQLYVKGQLLGGLDVMKEMNEAGELQEALAV